ncbi:MAG: Uncharacterised protein [Polaribacter sp. SA4-10]|nr:MAG: Uncharacterised protein [Polaribacter sp. SA4-10]
MKKFTLTLFYFFGITIYSQTFNEVSNAIGIDHVFQQFSHMGGGAVFFDYDNDGWEDIYITSGKGKDHLYKNNGNGNFNLITDNWLDITEQYYTTSVVSGDINNDGFRDLFVTTWRGEDNSGALERNLLFVNNGDGTFSENGIESGLNFDSFSMGSAMLDYDNDGYLDIYTINYIETSAFLYDGNGDINGYNHDCFENQFYRNNGDGTFSEISETLGLNNNGCALAVMPTDFDQDNDTDIYIANDFGEFIVPNTMLSNDSPTNSFTNVSVSTNMNIGLYGMGIAYADIDKDLDFDYYLTNIGRNVLIQNDGSQNFTDISTFAGVENTYTEGSTTLFTSGWGTAFFDVNNDTWPDLFVSNGKVTAADFIATGENDPNKLYINNGDLTFTDISNSAGINDFSRGRGMIYSDYDKDGDLDILVVVLDSSEDTNARTTLYQNQLNPNGSDSKNWVQISLQGTIVNRDAMGSKIELTVNGEKLIQEIHGQGSHASQSSLIAHFGLADNAIIDELKVIWSSTDTQVFTDLEVNKRYQLTQGSTLGNQNNNFIDFSMYPNPVKNNLNFQGINSKFKIKIYSIQGKLLDALEVNKTKTFINLSIYKTGVYVLKFFEGNNIFVTSKLIVKE